MVELIYVNRVILFFYSLVPVKDNKLVVPLFFCNLGTEGDQNAFISIYIMGFIIEQPQWRKLSHIY